MSQATEVYSREFDKRFFDLSEDLQRRIEDKIAYMGQRLKHFPHERLVQSDCYKLRVGDYRVLYQFDAEQDEVYLITVRHRREVYRK